jgi:enoyl-CoA hydratase
VSYENLLLEQPAPGVFCLTVNRPKAHNALNAATLAELTRAIGVVASDPAARVLLITGAGDKAFVAGADIAAMREMTEAQARAFSQAGMGVMQALEALPVPVIALVNGYALGGGCELALACDWIIASERAVFGQPEVNLGIPPGFGGTQRLLRRVGTARALELVTTGRQVKADEALRIGLATQVVAPAELMACGLSVAGTIAAKGPLAVRDAKRAVQQGQSLGLADGCAFETGVFAAAFATADQREGMTAFLDKRTPQFRGR